MLPKVPLGELYGDAMRAWFAKFDVEIRLNTAAKRLNIDNDRITHVELRDGSSIAAKWIVLAVPFDRVGDLLPSMSSKLEASPITSVHLWYDRDVVPLPHVVLIGCQAQWVFARGAGYAQVVVSASRELRSLGRDEIERRIADEMRMLFPLAREAKLLRSKVITEHTATFSATPGVDELRPSQETPFANLFLAGDWTKTDWPATMEGAVRSGYLAAEVLTRRAGQGSSFVQPDLR